MKYIPQLDSIRAVAVFLVLLCHWGGLGHLEGDRSGRLGALGVDVFFVLSGFLITGILFRGKEKVSAGRLSFFNVCKLFYIRRALRIFPIFYLLIGILFIASFFAAISRVELFYAATYTINLYFAKMQYWSAYTTHLWSLAVEEQFYIIWPLVILWVPKKWLPWLMLLCAAIAMVAQMHRTTEFDGLLTHTCLDAFAAGAILSWILRYRPNMLRLSNRVITVVGVLALLVFCYQYLLLFSFPIPQRSLHACIGLLFISNIVYANKTGNSNLLHMLADNRILIAAGKISYGLYLYHLVIPLAVNGLLQKLHAPVQNVSFVWLFLLYLAILVIISMLSWKFVEQPFLHLKKRFAADED